MRVAVTDKQSQLLISTHTPAHLSSPSCIKKKISFPQSSFNNILLEPTLSYSLCESGDMQISDYGGADC